MWWEQEQWWIWWKCHAELQWGGLLWGRILLDDLSSADVVLRAFFFPRTHVQVVISCFWDVERRRGWKWGSREHEGWLSEKLHVWQSGKKQEAEAVTGYSLTSYWNRFPSPNPCLTRGMATLDQPEVPPCLGHPLIPLGRNATLGQVRSALLPVIPQLPTIHGRRSHICLRAVDKSAFWIMLAIGIHRFLWRGLSKFFQVLDMPHAELIWSPLFLALEETSNSQSLLISFPLTIL